MSFVKEILTSWFFLLLGYLIIVLPAIAVYLGFYYVGGDIDFKGGLILATLEGFIITGLVIFFDILVTRFLLKLAPRKNTYFITGLVIALIFSLFFLYEYNK